MKTASNVALALLATCCLVGSPSEAAGPVDGEFGAVWWENTFDASSDTASLSSDAGAPGYRAELWLFNKYGLRAGAYSSDLQGIDVDASEYMSVDLLWRPYSPTENSFVALGVGYQRMDLAAIGFGDDTAGPRLALEGRIGLGPVYLYGQGSYAPELDETAALNPADGIYRDLTGYEGELGVSWSMFPFVALRGGYRLQNVEFTRTDFDPVGTEVKGETESDGFLLGLTFKF